MCYVNNNLSKFYPGYYYNGTDTTSDIYAAMPNRSALFFSTNGDQKVGNELGFSKSYQGANVIIWKSSEWRGGALAIPNAGDGILLMAQISGSNALTWKNNEIASKSDLINLFFSTRTTSDLLYVSSDFSFGTTLTNSSTKNVPASDKNGIALTLGNSDVSNCIVVWIPLGRKPDGIYINTFIKSNNIWFGWQKIQLIDV